MTNMTFSIIPPLPLLHFSPFLIPSFLLSPPTGNYPSLCHSKNNWKKFVPEAAEEEGMFCVSTFFQKCFNLLSLTLGIKNDITTHT